MSTGMKLGTLITLARPRSGTDRRRMLLTVTSIGLAGAFLLAGWRVKRLGFSSYFDSPRYSDYLQESGLRSGVVTAAALLAVAAGALAFQALKLGTAARDRRLSTLRLAGATPDQVRRVGAVDAGLAGLAGGILAGPLYGVLALLFQTLPRVGRILPQPNLVDLATWPIVAVVLTVAAAVAGGTLRREVIAEPLAATPATPIRVRVLAVVGTIGLVMTVAGATMSVSGYDSYVSSFARLLLLTCGVMLTACALAPYLIVLAGRRMSGAADPLKLLAGGRLIRTARAAARTSVLLVICGMATAISAYGIVDAIVEQMTSAWPYSVDPWFRVTGFGLAAAAAIVVGAIAGVALLAGAVDDLLDQRRQFAYLSIFGVGEAQLRRSVRQQLAVTTATATAVGLLAGSVLYSLHAAVFEQPNFLLAVPVVLIGTAFAWLVTSAASLFLRSHIRDAINPANLRTP